MRPYFKEFHSKVFICSNLEDAKKQGIDKNSKVLIFGALEYKDIEEYAKNNNIVVIRTEDGLIRSVTLGSTFTRPASIILDTKGIYFNPLVPSNLEDILQNYDFSKDELERATKLQQSVIEAKFSKYNHLEHKKLNIDKSKYDKIILVVGQVDDDMSIKLGGYGLKNKDLLQLVRQNNPNSYIIYKPHPDVLSGNRIGHIPKEITDKYANEVQTYISIDSCINASDEVHTITSASGFDALLRGKKVYTYGMPFYAGWGLTTDYRTCKRRTRKLQLSQLIAAVLIVYPIYLSPKHNKFCSPEQALQELKELQELYFNNKLYKLYVDFKGYILPKVRKYIKKLAKKFNINKKF
jgi:capsular polysaccharide export protein